MDKLEQRKLFVRKEFALGEHGLKYEFKNLTSSIKAEIPYEELGTKRIYQELTNGRALVFTIFMFMASTAKTYYFITGKHDDFIFTMVVLSIFLILLIGTFYSYKKSVLIEAVNPAVIEFYAQRPNEDAVESFLNELQLRTKNYLIKKYAERDTNIPLETQLETLSVLKNRNIITEKEYGDLTNKLSNPSNKPIGFSRTSE